MIAPTCGNYSMFERFKEINNAESKLGGRWRAKDGAGKEWWALLGLAEICWSLWNSAGLLQTSPSYDRLAEQPPSWEGFLPQWRARIQEDWWNSKASVPLAHQWLTSNPIFHWPKQCAWPSPKPGRCGEIDPTSKEGGHDSVSPVLQSTLGFSPRC